MKAGRGEFGPTLSQALSIIRRRNMRGQPALINGEITQPLRTEAEYRKGKAMSGPTGGSKAVDRTQGVMRIIGDDAANGMSYIALGIDGREVCHVQPTYDEQTDTFGLTEADDDIADRITACWNAMAGIADPAAFVADAKELARITIEEADDFQVRKKMAMDFVKAMGDA